MSVVNNVREIVNIRKISEELYEDVTIGTRFTGLMSGPGGTIVNFLGELNQSEEDYVNNFITNYVDTPLTEFVVEEILRETDKFYVDLKRSFASKNSALGIRYMVGETRRVADLFAQVDFYMNNYAYPEAFVEIVALPLSGAILTQVRIDNFAENLHQFIYHTPFDRNNYLAHEGV